MAKRRDSKSRITMSGQSRYVMTKEHRDNISKGLKAFHRGHGSKYRIVKSVGKRLRTGMNDNQTNGPKLSMPRSVVVKPRDKHVEHVRKHFSSKALVKRELKDYRKLKQSTRRGQARRSDLAAYRKRARRRFLASKLIGKVKSLFGR